MSGFVDPYRMLLGWWSKPAAIAPGPGKEFVIVARDSYVPGATQSDSYAPGAAEGDSYAPGAVAGDSFIPET